MIQFFFEDTKE